MKHFTQKTRKWAEDFDTTFGTTIKTSGGKIYRAILNAWSPIKRVYDPLIIRKYPGYGLQNPSDPIRLHLGCGWKRLPGYINIDLWQTDATDILCDINSLPWPDNSVKAIDSYHVVEHISHRRVYQTLREWHRVLCSGGRLVLECPDFDQAIQEYLDGDENRLFNIFGRQRFPGDTHLYGYNAKRLAQLLSQVGFIHIEEQLPQSSQILDEPCFRLVGEKT